ncbi:MAG: MBL fold metallo-hydrolase [Hyphomicrobiales bacterium]|nr:MBL fold metallo-hydrolase [Hyphomicrobiales bacterium]MCP5370977.1 MBL fold metallo-hydrolase [Hyphomicrobiales bacterium]
MKITLLGTGTPTPSLKRQSSGYLIEVGDDLIVMDHGPGAHHRLIESGARAVDVTHVFLSHLHYDHCMDYTRLVLQRWDIGADLIPDLKVYGPPPLKRMTEQLFSEDGVYGPDIRARVNHQGSIDVFKFRGGVPPRKWPAPQVTELKPGDVVDGGKWKLTVAEASHVQPYLECYAYRIDSDEGSMCYSGDSGAVCPAVIDLARGVDVLIHMNHYRTGTEPTEIYREVCGNPIDNAHIAREAGVKTLVLTHFLEQIDQPGIRERILREMMEIYDGDIVWGEDLMVIPVKGPRLAKME